MNFNKDDVSKKCKHKDLMTIASVDSSGGYHLASEVCVECKSIIVTKGSRYYRIKRVGETEDNE